MSRAERVFVSDDARTGRQRRQSLQKFRLKSGLTQPGSADVSFEHSIPQQPVHSPRSISAADKGLQANGEASASGSYASQNAGGQVLSPKRGALRAVGTETVGGLKMSAPRSSGAASDTPAAFRNASVCVRRGGMAKLAWDRTLGRSRSRRGQRRVAAVTALERHCSGAVMPSLIFIAARGGTGKHCARR